MTPSGPARHQELQPSQQLLEDYLRELLGRIHPRRVLLLCHGPNDIHCLREQPGTWLVTLRTEGSVSAGPVICKPSELPFGEGEFDMVILHDAVGTGTDETLHEGCRMLRAGGHLLLIGRGSLRGARLPSASHRKMSLGRVSRAIERNGFRIIERCGMGLFRSGVLLDRAWQRPLLACCDQVLIRAKHRERESMVKPLRFSRPASAQGRSAALDGLSRQAAR